MVHLIHMLGVWKGSVSTRQYRPHFLHSPIWSTNKSRSQYQSHLTFLCVMYASKPLRLLQ